MAAAGATAPVFAAAHARGRDVRLRTRGWPSFPHEER